LLADDYREFLEVERRLLEPEFEVVKIVYDGRAAVDEAARLEPDLLVLDVSMSVMDGITAVRSLQKYGLRSKAVILTVHSDPDFARAALAAGALGYVVKYRLVSDLIPALRAALAGRSFVSPFIGLERTGSQVP
jgi:DNA-binding NarL/FixJ family response regulator